MSDVFADKTRPEIEAAVERGAVLLLPLGQTEQHGPHLPVGCDSIIAERVALATAGALAGDPPALVLPTIPYGTHTNQMEFPLAMNVNPSTLTAIITDLVDSLVQHGILKILLLNSHGGNDFKPVLRELCGRTPAKLFLCNWYQIIGDVYDEIFDERDDHAGEMETSLALAYCPELVARREDGTLTADAGEKAPTRFEAVNRGWVGITRPWHLLTTNAGAGNPHAATADKGRRLMDVLVERLGSFLVELSAAEVDERFPY